MAMISFLKIIAALKKSRQMLKYNRHEGLNERMPNYEVKMGFGLHLGWAIEGAIGSIFKIDASYLSPNVNMAARLEELTKYYGVPMLMTGELYDNFTTETQGYCREVDCVQIKGRVLPLRLYVCDVDATKLKLDDWEPKLTLADQRKARVRARLARDRYKRQIFSSEIQVSGLFLTNPDLKAMRVPITNGFSHTFKRAY